MSQKVEEIVIRALRYFNYVSFSKEDYIDFLDKIDSEICYLVELKETDNQIIDESLLKLLDDTIDLFSNEESKEENLDYIDINKRLSV